LVGFTGLDPEPVVERAPVLDDRQGGGPVHRHAETIEEAVLAEQYGPRCAPVVDKADLGLPLDNIVVVVAIRMLKAD
jgi:hypothetical protein